MCISIIVIISLYVCMYCMYGYEIYLQECTFIYVYYKHEPIYINMLIFKHYLSSRINSQPWAILQPILAFGRPKSILIAQIACTFSIGQQSITYNAIFKKRQTNF